MSESEPRTWSTSRELILGGQKSGKSRAAEARAAHWLGQGGREALLIATAQAGDAEMADRISRHRNDRAVRIPALKTLEDGTALPVILARWSEPHRLILVDCLTLWLTQLLMPLDGPAISALDLRDAIDSLASSARQSRGPLVFVSNEIGMGVSPPSAEARRFIDALGMLHQSIAAVCDRVTLTVAGCELAIRSAIP